MFGRPLSPFILSFFETRAAKDARAYNTQLAMKITLKTGAVVYYATASMIIDSLSQNAVSVTLGSPMTFFGKIIAAPELSHSQTDSNDGGTAFTITNLDYLISALIPEPDRLFDGAQVTFYIGFPKPSGNYEGLVYAKGLLKSVSGDHNEASISFVSDVSDKDNKAGGRELTQRCLNVLGVNQGRSWCGAIVDPSDTCSKILDDEENGCVFWGQEHAFQGIPFFNPNGLIANYSGDASGTGIGGDIIGCFDVNSYYRTVERIKQGFELRRGDKLLNHRDEVMVIERLEVFWAEHRYRVRTTSGASAIVSATHKFLTRLDDGKGTCITSLLQTDKNEILQKQIDDGVAAPYESLPRIVEYIRGRGVLSSFEATVAPSGYCVKIKGTAPHTYVGGEEQGKYLSAHNLKPYWE